MITVTTNEWNYIEIDGHAGYAPHGSDIVCASVSVLYETFKSLFKHNNRVTVTEARNVSRIEICKGSFLSGYMEFFTEGIEGIAEAYPDHVELIIDR